VAAAAVVSVQESKDVTTAPTTRSDGRRRTERVRREKPNYYDASAFIRKTRVSWFVTKIVSYIHLLVIFDVLISLEFDKIPYAKFLTD